MKKKLIIYSGIPCSGKSTTAKNYLGLSNGGLVVSRDTLRETYFGDNYNYSKSNEQFISDKFDEIMDHSIENPLIKYIIIDNTHCKEKYLDNLIKIYGKVFDIQIVFFELTLFKAYYRNFVRFFKTGKWIPINVIKNMYSNYNKINKSKYKYLLD